MESQTLLSIMLAILLVATIFQAIQIGRLSDELGQVRTNVLTSRAVQAASALSAAQAGASAPASKPAAAQATPLSGYASQVGGC